MCGALQLCVASLSLDLLSSTVSTNFAPTHTRWLLLLFVPQDEKEEALESAMGKKGFGKAPVSFEAIFDKENYVARPADEEAWKAYVDQELSDALKQVRRRCTGEAVSGGIGLCVCHLIGCLVTQRVRP